MMKKILSVLLFTAITTVSWGQAALPVGRAQLNLGLGISGWGLPVYAGFDVGVHRNITLGAELSYRSYKEDFKNNRYRHHIFGFSGNGNFHFNNLLHIPGRFDVYAGLNLGFFVWSSPSGYPGDQSSGLGLGAQIGGRYYFSPKAGINLEFGGGNAFYGGKFGLTFKL